MSIIVSSNVRHVSFIFERDISWTKERSLRKLGRHRLYAVVEASQLELATQRIAKDRNQSDQFDVPYVSVTG